MNIPILFLWILVLSGGYSATSIDNTEHSNAPKELDELRKDHTLQSLNPILRYIDQLQNETNEINDLREKVQQLQLKIAESKLRDDLIAKQDSHIKDLQATNSELRDTNLILKQNFESVNSAIDHFKLEFSKTDSNVSYLRLCEEQLLINNRTITQNTAQLKSKDADLKTCESSLSEYQVQSSSAIDLRNRLLKESQSKLNENQDDIRKLKEIIQEKDQKISKLTEQIEKTKFTCATYGISNGVHSVAVPNTEPFRALCNNDIAGSGWTVIQQRINGGEDFNRKWEAYKNGFGKFTGDFFLGLEKIHRLTNDTPHELYIHMEAFKGGKVERHYGQNIFHARYDNFSIAGEDDKYRLLSLGSYSGNADWDRMRLSEHQQFTTRDNDNDLLEGDNCAHYRDGGWWYAEFATCNLNGKYYEREVSDVVANWWGYYDSLKTIKMMIRPRGN